MANNKAVFLEGSLMRHVSVMSFTSGIGLMAVFAVDFVDMVFIGMLGSDALAAAVGYAGTLLFFTNAINIGLSIAAGSLVARSVGADETENAQQFATSVAVFAAMTGVFVPILAYLFLPQLLGFLGAQGEVQALAARYMTIILPSMPIMGIAMVSFAVLRAYGDARRATVATIVGGVVNAVLDPILIFGVGLGLDGAAYASVCARIVMMGMALWPAIKAHDAFARPDAAMVVRDVRAVSAIALPAVLTNVATPIGNAIVTREIAQFGTDAVAGMAIIGRLMPVAFSIVFALSGAIGPIVGQNFGAARFERVRGAYWAGIQFTAIYVACAALVLFILREPIGALFDAEGETLTLLFWFCGPLALASVFNGIIFVSNAAFNNLGHPVYSTWINWGRHTLGTLPFAVLGGMWFGAPGVLIGQAAGGVFFAIIAMAIAQRLMTSLNRPKEVDPFAEQKRFHMLFWRGRW